MPLGVLFLLLFCYFLTPVLFSFCSLFVVSLLPFPSAEGVCRFAFVPIAVDGRDGIEQYGLADGPSYADVRCPDVGCQQVVGVADVDGQSG